MDNVERIISSVDYWEARRAEESAEEALVLNIPTGDDIARAYRCEEAQ
jgi:hypothetical protein